MTQSADQQRQLLFVALGVAVAILLVSLLLAVRLATLEPAVQIIPVGERGAPGWQGRGRGPWMAIPDGNVPPVVDESEARGLAMQWLADNQPAARLGTVRRMRHGYVFAVVARGRTIGVIMADDRAGRVVAHGWTRAGPTPSPTT